MDQFGATAAEETASSVGAAFRDKQIYSIQHPAYVGFSEDVVEELSRVSERVAAQRSTTRRVILTGFLTPEQLSSLSGLYPEFTPVVVPMSKPVHGFLRACQDMANEWCAVVTAKYSDTCLHYGGSILRAMARRASKTHVEYDRSDSIAVHKYHSETVDAHRLFQDYAAVQSSYGVLLPRKEYDEYLRGNAYRVCDGPGACAVKVGAVCVDLTATPLSPVQVALGMLQHGAEICHGFYFYHPAMLVQKQGEIPGLGVHFETSDTSIQFHYPEGRSGVTSYSRKMYACWLISHSFRVVGNEWFQLELLKNRGGFMFFRMVKIDEPKVATHYVHALDMPADDEYTVVNSWKLKDGFKSDPALKSSWEEHTFLARSRIVRRVREYAMQLKPTDFNRFAIKKQIRVVNNRWVVNGTTVSVSAPLTPQEIEELTTAIYARAFVDRYDSSQLSAEMMSRLKNLVGFHSASFSERLAAVAAAAMHAVYESTLGRLEDWTRVFLDSIISVFSSGLSGDMKVGLRPAPTYTTLSSVANSWKTLLSQYGEVLFSADAHGYVSPIVDSSMGGSLGSVFWRFRPSARFGARAFAQQEARLEAAVRVITCVEDTRVHGDDADEGLADAVGKLNEMDMAPERRYMLEFARAERGAGEAVQAFKRAEDPDPVHSLNSLYLECFPSVANQALEYDTFSLSLDPQDRVLAAPYLRMSTYFGLPPAPRAYYPSKLKALNVPKRQNTAPELLTAISARNLNAPVVAIPQEAETVIPDIWNNFLDTCCVPDAREKLLEYRSDPVALASEALTDWASRAKPSVVDQVKQELATNSKAMGELPVDEYLAMLKADVKPTLSTRPVNEVTAPQVIVYHNKAVNTLYSSIFRVLVRRFLSLLDSRIHVNLLKDNKDIGEFITQNHPFGEENLKYLENDFSKFDKSQSKFVFELEEYVFRQLGLNEEMLERWVHGHVECSIRSVSVGLTLHVMYQRKSGDSTTAFGNVILNILSVSYAYKGTSIVWAVFMGDDSLVCTRALAADTDAVQMLAEIFNLSAKYYVTDAPYFASCFVLLDSVRLTASMCPDPIKRIERLSMHVGADDPQWPERYISFCDTMAVFRDESVVQHLSVRVPRRYEVSEGLVRAAAGALGTCVSNFCQYRSLWAENPEVIQA